VEREVYQRMAALESDHWWFAARREILAAVVRKAGLPRDARILEAGCGTGGNLAMLGQFGQVQAFEPDADARAWVQSTRNVVVQPGALPDEVPFDDAAFDLVTAFDVIEHVDAPEQSVERLTRHVRPGGWLLLTVPAYRFLWSRHDERHHHRRRYTRGELVRLVEGAGAQVRHCSYFNTLLFPAIAGVRLAKGLTGSEIADDSMPSPLLNGVLRRIFSAEQKLVARVPLPFGVSLVALAQRQG
jgi:SAM-dependent methyltransferase